MSAGGLATVRQARRGSADSAPPIERLPADGLLHPMSLVALGLLLVNDHILKAVWPGALTGKLSDVAGLVFFPILVLSAGELVLVAAGRWRRPTWRALTFAVAGSATAFASVKILPDAADAAGWVFGAAQWLFSIPFRVMAGTLGGPVRPTVIVVDPTDLLALPFVAVAIWIGRSRLR